MASYSEFIDRLLLQPYLLQKLCPAEPISYDLVHKVRDAGPAQLLGARVLQPGASPEMLRGGLYYVVDAIEPAHRIFQAEKGDLGSYWHGMMHRREGDFDNARYWFRRAGRLPFFSTLQRAAGEVWELAARQLDWDPYLFTGQCEQARFGAEIERELARVQMAEFEVILDYVWRQTVTAE